MDIKISSQEYEVLKECVKEWIVSMNREETLPECISALNFGLYEPFGIELIGAKEYDQDNDDWACEEDFIPTQRECPDIKVDKSIGWEAFLNIVVRILQELISELKDLEILNVEHITTGFCDGDLVVIR